MCYLRFLYVISVPSSARDGVLAKPAKNEGGVLGPLSSESKMLHKVE